MASLFIKDHKTAEAVARVAQRMATSKTSVVREAVLRLEAALDSAQPAGAAKRSSREIIEQFWKEHPLPPPTGLKADKAFFDELSGDL